MLGGAFEQKGAGKKKKEEKKEQKREGGGVRGGARGGRVFKRFRSHNIKYSSCEIKDLVETHLCKLVCDTPIARFTHICRGLLYA